MTGRSPGDCARPTDPRRSQKRRQPPNSVRRLPRQQNSIRGVNVRLLKVRPAGNRGQRGHVRRLRRRRGLRQRRGWRDRVGRGGRRGRSTLAAIAAMRADPLHSALADGHFLRAGVNHEPVHLADLALAPAALLATIVAGFAAVALAAATLFAAAAAGNANFFADAAIFVLRDLFRLTVNVADGNERAAAVRTAVVTGVAARLSQPPRTRRRMVQLALEEGCRPARRVQSIRRDTSSLSLSPGRIMRSQSICA